MIEISNLNYLCFKNFNLKIEKNTYTSIVGCNKSGKTLLFKIISGLILVNKTCKCNGVELSNNNYFDYVKNIGIIPCVNENSFVYKTVSEELIFSLSNYGYPKFISKQIIKNILKEMNLLSIYDASIESLTLSSKQKLMFVIAFLHNPKVILIDDVFSLLNNKDKKVILKYLDKLKQKGLTIVHFTTNLNEVIKSDCLCLLNDYTIKKSGNPLELLEDDQLFYQCGLEIPFMIDLSVKLKMYNLLDSVCLNMEEVVNKLWK